MNANERRSVRGGPAVQNLLLAACQAFHLRGIQVLLGRSRVQAVTRARCYAASVLRGEGFNFSTPEIGKILGGRDHSSIFYYLKRHAMMIKYDVAGFPASVREAELIRERLGRLGRILEEIRKETDGVAAEEKESR